MAKKKGSLCSRISMLGGKSNPIFSQSRRSHKKLKVQLSQRTQMVLPYSYTATADSKRKTKGRREAPGWSLDVLTCQHNIP